MPHRLSLTTKNGQYEFYGKLTDFEEKYEALTRINRSCLANLKNVQKRNYRKLLGDNLKLKPEN